MSSPTEEVEKIVHEAIEKKKKQKSEYGDVSDYTIDPDYECVVCGFGRETDDCFRSREQLWCDWCDEIQWFKKL